MTNEDLSKGDNTSEDFKTSMGIGNYVGMPAARACIPAVLDQTTAAQQFSKSADSGLFGASFPG